MVWAARSRRVTATASDRRDWWNLCRHHCGAVDARSEWVASLVLNLIGGSRKLLELWLART